MNKFPPKKSTFGELISSFNYICDNHGHLRKSFVANLKKTDSEFDLQQTNP